mmetsp:Transcript_36062/g.101528  ORF Transcript_36062/g.101528 Transcript_36062/m.101528 type:complete len:92 (-) Transcript_36062:136-411(-)
MYPNVDGWLSVETVDRSGARVTVFHGLLIPTAAARVEWKEQIRRAVRDHLARDESAMQTPCELVPLLCGKVHVSVPRAAAAAGGEEGTEVP